MSINVKRNSTCTIIVLLFLVVALSGCSQGQTKSEEQPLQTLEPSNTQAVNLQLYFLDSNEMNWSIETRNVDVPADISWAEMTINELISGPKDENNTSVLPTDTIIDKVVVVNGLANVYLSGGFDNLSMRDELKARVAITNSLCSLQDIEYVGIYGGGDYTEFNNPQAYSQYEGDFSMQLSELENEEVEIKEKKWMNIPLYFLDCRNMKINPEVRNCSFFTDDIASVIVNELLKGPSDEQIHNEVFDPISVTVTDVSTISDSQGKAIVKIEMSNVPGYGLNITKGYEATPYAAIVFSITSSMPDVNGVVFVVDGEIVKEIGNNSLPENGIITREMMSNFESGEVSLYFPNQQKDSLVRVTRAVPFEEGITAKRWIEELINGPQAGEDESVWPSFPNNILQEDVLDVYLDDDLAIVDFSKQVLESCQGKEWSIDEESVFIYSIVNTLCEINGIKRVQILVEGTQVTSLGDNINTFYPLMPNVGIVDY